MKFKKEDMLWVIEGGRAPDIEIENVGDWIDDGKYSYKEVVFRYKNKLYILSDSRSGSYFTSYTYNNEYWDDEVECPEVIAKEIITTIYVKA